jgi:hypothetical protein
MFHGRVWPGVWVTVLLLSAAARSVALAGPFVIVSNSAVADPAARQVDFTVTFNRAPDFFHVDQDSRPINAFQYFYDSQPGDGVDEIYSGPDVVVIRGPEIRFADSIPIRDSLNPDGVDLPHAEGWGKMRGDVAFELSGATLHFSVPWKDLGESDAAFSYHLITVERGDLTSEVSAGGPIAVPLPPAVLSAALMTATAATLPLALRAGSLFRRPRSRQRPRHPLAR